MFKNGKVILEGRDLKLFEAGEDVGWNAAIETAALIVQPNPNVDEKRRCEDIAAVIRSLKK